MEKTEELLRTIDRDLQGILSQERYEHSIGVMKKSEELARKYGIDIYKAKLAGLAHDIAKEMSKEEKLEYIKENNIIADEIEKVNVGLLHAKIGADICKKRYGFTKDMQDAIINHTVGNPEMDDLAKVILVADKTESGRKYEDLEQAKEIASIGLNEAVVYIIDISIKNTIERGSLIHPDGVETRNKLIQKLNSNK